MADATGKYRLAQIETALGPDVLLLERLSGREELARLFEYSVDLISERASIKAEDILATNLTMAFETPDADTPRYINGFVTQFAVRGEVRTSAFTSGLGYGYRAVVRPWLWLATRRSDCRIFNNKSVRDIIKEVLSAYGGEIEDQLSANYEPWTYCVQYRETDFNFVSRLMEQEGIYYFFLHANGKHKLALADSMSAHVAHPKFGSFRFGQPGLQGVTEYDYLNEWSAETSIQPGKFLHRDYDFFKARGVEGMAANPRNHTFGDLEVYDYPSEGLDTAGSKEIKYRTSNYAGIRMEELQSQYRVMSGAGNMRGLEVGRKFKLTDHPQKENNVEYLIISTQISATVNEYASGGGGGADFHVHTTAMQADQTFRPQRITPKPLVQGAQTAVVVGSGEIDTDEFGRVKLQFHWDRLGGTCWARVAQTMAGNKWGAVSIPRVGHEVVVEFLEGDPDHPIVTGVVYNGVSKPPYALPGEKTKSTLKTNSSEGGQGFNELRFEDKKGSEQIFVHAEKDVDLRIKNDRYEWIGNNRHLIVKVDKLEKIESNRSEVVGNDVKIEIGRDHNLKVKGKSAVEITGSNTLVVKGDVTEEFDANHSEKTTKDYFLKAKQVVIETDSGITLKCGGSHIVINPSGVTIESSGQVIIQGSLTKVNSGPGTPPTPGIAGAAVAPAAPDAAEEADKADPGEMAKIKSEQTETKTGRYGSTPVKRHKPPQSGSDPKKTWVEIEFLDEQNNPVAGQPYKVTLPDGSEITGTLDERGRARVEGVDPGQCKVTFLGLNEDTWRRR